MSSSHEPKSRHPRWIRPLGVALAILMPAAVVAQVAQFRQGDVLTAAQLNVLVNRLNQLEGQALRKSDVYERSAQSAPLPQGEQARVDITCQDNNDILLDCSCGASTAGGFAVDVRRVASSQRGDNLPAICQCNGLAVAASSSQLVTAVASCLAVD